MRVIILKQKPKDVHSSMLQVLKFSKQSTEPNGHEIYPNDENFQQFLNKLTIDRNILYSSQLELDYSG